MYTRPTIARRSCSWWREKQGRQIGRNKARRYNPLVLSRGCLRPFYCPCTLSLCLLVFSPSCKHPTAEGLPEKSFNGIVGIWITRNTIRDQNLVAPFLHHPFLAASSLSSNLGGGEDGGSTFGIELRSTVPRRCPPGLIVGSSSSSIRSSRYCRKNIHPFFFFSLSSLRVTKFRSSAWRAGLGGWLHIQRCIENRNKIPRRRYQVILKNNSLLRYVSWKNISVYSSWGLDTPMT